MNRLTTLFAQKRQNILTVYYTAGFPHLEDTRTILRNLAQAGADVIEIGMPFSDPIADGEVIQQSNQKALQNGMSIEKLLEQLAGFRAEIPNTPVLLMGYLNPVLQYGIENFVQQTADLGIDGLILPDLPLQEYLDNYRAFFEAKGLSSVFLITPQTSEARIRLIDESTQGFLYAVSSASTTGRTTGISAEQETYFARLRDMHLRNPFQIGFGISDRASFATACQYASGAIIGSAFIRLLAQSQDISGDIARFVREIKLT